jgi:hypothetical protein
VTTADVEPRERSDLARFLRTMFIVPMAQIRIFDLPYQVYVFEVFHASRANRWSHYIGIPVSLAALYILLSPLPLGPEIALAIVVAVQIGMCVGGGLRSLIPLVVLANSALWLLSLHVLDRVFVFGGSWWAHPAFHVLLWPALQYTTHLLERDLPPPWSGNDQWISTLAFVRGATPRLVVKAIAFAPLHVIVELVSMHRNSFVLLLLTLERLGYRAPQVVAMRRWIDAECARTARVVEYDEFRQRWASAS